MAQKIMVTGSSGFLAKHIVLQLLQQGYAVRGSVRSDHRAEELREVIRNNIDDSTEALARLEFVHLDLTSDDGWTEALSGVDALIHTASPFLLAQPKDENELIRPAVDGTLRALKAAKQAGVDRVILTSSAAAINTQAKPDSDYIFDETDWTDVNAVAATPYIKSKTMAEKAAWDFVENDAPEMKLTVINPGLIVGPALDQNYGSSLELIERILRGSDPALPRFGFSVVDVRDVATAHILPLNKPKSVGKRVIVVAEGWVWMRDLAAVLAEGYPQHKTPKMAAPDWLVKLLSVFDSSLKQIVPVLGIKQELSPALSKDLLGLEYYDWKESLLESARVVDAKITASR